MGIFSEKVVCVTGADGGIGREITKKFAAEGATLILTSIAQSETFDSFIVELKNDYGVEVYPFFFDLSDEEAIKSAIKDIKALKLKINVLINNAGMPHLAIVPFTKMADVKKVFQVNYFAQFQITQGLLGSIAKDGESVILNAASIAGIDGDPQKPCFFIGDSFSVNIFHMFPGFDPCILQDVFRLLPIGQIEKAGFQNRV
jgi:3-oxoacyl-[acyl-carrier protein] reductase